MVPRKVIADSDDEDDGFSPETSPLKPSIQPPANHSSSYGQADATSSTDSRFFGSIYHQQQNSILDAEPVVRNDAARGGDTMANNSCLEPADSEHPSVLTPITDPAGALNSRMEAAIATVIDMTPTQIGTPERIQREASARDIWDVPSSGEQTQPTSKSHKRLPDAGTDDSTSRDQISKRRKTTDKRTSGAVGQQMSGADMSTEPALSLYIEPRTMSPNRRLLYRAVHSSFDDQNRAGLDPNMATIHTSSGSATIAYPTPTQARGSMVPMDNSVTQNPPQSPNEHRGERGPIGPIEPASSPDIIVTHEASFAKPAPHGSPNEVVEFDDDGVPQERYQPRPSRRRLISGGMENPDQTTAARVEEPIRGLFDPGPDSIPPRRRRGRPRKSDESEQAGAEGRRALPLAEAGPIGIEGAEQTTGDVQGEPRKEKRKRGRPRKTDQAAADGDAAASKKSKSKRASSTPRAGVDSGMRQEGNDQTNGDLTKSIAAHDGLWTETPLAATGAPPAQDKRENQAGPTPPKADHAAQKTSGASSPGSGHMASKEKFGKSEVEETGKAPSREPPRAPATPSRGKPVYRVGLSKRSRIAPLLKSLRKT